MTFRTKLLVAFAATVGVAVALVTIAVGAVIRNAFERLDQQRTEALVAQFRKEFERRGAEITRRLDRLSETEAMRRTALDLARPDPDLANYYSEAGTVASSLGLDFLEILRLDGTIVSSAQYAARFGYKDDWAARVHSSGLREASLRREELAEETVLALVAVRAVAASESTILLAGGQRIDSNFLASLTLPQGLRVLLYKNLGGPADPALTGFAPLIERVRINPREASQIFPSSREAPGGETVYAIPLVGREGDLLGALLVASSRRDLANLQQSILWLGLGVGLSGIFIGILISWWATARVSRPVRQLAEAADKVAQGDWQARVAVDSTDEIGGLARAFNQMTRQLIEQRERLVQSERVAAWRELARRLAHELKNPLFPLQITVENLRRAREQHPEQFDEVFRESTETLLAELSNLKTIIGRFSEFAKMPPPQRQLVQVNEIVRNVVKLFQAQLSASHVAAEIALADDLPQLQADPEQLQRALQNLVLNAIDAMPSGGRLAIRTSRVNGATRLQISDTGAGLTREECERLFTPYYTTKHHGTGLGLAIVQSVVSDHGGKISVESEPGRGATFSIDLG